MSGVLNAISNSDFILTGLSTIVEGNVIHTPVTVFGNFLENTSENKILQTVGKVAQSITTASLTVWATVHLAEAFTDSWKYCDLTINTSIGLAGVVLSMPIVFQLAKNSFPESREKIANFQKMYSTAIKVINVVTAAIVLGWFAILGPQCIVPILLSSISLSSSLYNLQKKEVTLAFSERKLQIQ